MPSIKCPQRNIQHSTLYAHVTLRSSLNKTASCHSVWLPTLLSSLFFLFFKYHMPLDSKANDMLMGAECSCQFVVGFLSVKWKIRFGRQFRCGSYHNNLVSHFTPPPLPTLSPAFLSLLLILLVTVWLNGQNPWTDWYIVLTRVTWGALPLYRHHHYLPPPHPPRPQELLRWQVINPNRHGCGGVEGGGGGGTLKGGWWGRWGWWCGWVGSCNTNLKEISPHA